MNDEHLYRFVTPSTDVPPVRMGALAYLTLVEWCLIAIAYDVPDVKIPYLMPSRNVVLVSLSSSN